MFFLSTMKINSWNVRGINASDKRHKIKQVVDSMQAYIIFLQETKLSQDNFDKIVAKWKKWKYFHAHGIGASGGLATLWNPLTVNAQLIQKDNNWQMLHISTFDISFILINVYGPSSSKDKACLWETITHSIQIQELQQVVIGGDFNALLSQVEKIGGIIPPPKTLQDFNCFVDNNNLMDIHPRNGSFTWRN